MKLFTQIFGASASVIIGASLIGVAIAAHSPLPQSEPMPTVITPEPEYNREALIEAIEAETRERELIALKQYEQADFEFMRGDAELPEE
ncbi:hypothetical protein [Neisseria dumasiana]|uniref:Uncharacterized protein n=1 Tax=Neisseria dumasiana TaxID=1931275 RepID=A0A1X3DHB0_9NEIS|nr:hypothetical protein [Neisseria dumasiana]OSI20421.1 hypothetical protein BV912_07575 [Neisseria dumasiana]